MRQLVLDAIIADRNGEQTDRFVNVAVVKTTMFVLLKRILLMVTTSMKSLFACLPLILHKHDSYHGNCSASCRTR